MGLLADGAVRHGAGLEALHNCFNRLYLIDRHRRDVVLEFEQPAQSIVTRTLFVDQRGEHLELTIIVGTGRFLERGDRQRIVLMLLAIFAPLVDAARRKCHLGGNPFRIGSCVTLHQLPGDPVNIGASDSRRRPGEIAVDYALMQAERLEDLRAAITLHGGNSHLGHGLDNTLDGGFDEVFKRFFTV